MNEPLGRRGPGLVLSKGICNRVVTETKAPPVVQPEHAVLPDGRPNAERAALRAVYRFARSSRWSAQNPTCDQWEHHRESQYRTKCRPPGVRAPVRQEPSFSPRQFRQGLRQTLRRRAELRVLHRRPVAPHINRIHHRQRASHAKHKAQEATHRRGPEGRHPPSLAAQRARVAPG
jgi:hypothetical protein